jgi:zinc protease
MKRLTNLFAALSLVAVLGCATADTTTTRTARSDIPTSWRQIEAPELRSFDVQQPRRIELENGLVLFLQEDRELPLIRGTISIRGGSRDEALDKRGLTAIYGQAWRTGGTTSRTGDELDDFLEARAAVVETSSAMDSTSISWDSLSQDFDDVFPIVVDLMRHPAFRQDKIDLAKNQMNTMIARRNDDPGSIASREARRLVYGDVNPFAWVAEYDTVAAVTQDDLRRWHERTANPNNMVVGISGDFDPVEMERRLRAALGEMPRGEAFEVREIDLQTAAPGIYLVRKEDVTQTNIRFVHPGVVRNNPDYWAIRVMNEIFGGGFSARLFSSIRSDQGLAYSVWGGIGSAYDHPGMFSVSMGTGSGSTLQAIKALYGEIDKLQAGPITEQELVRAQESLLNSFIFTVDSREKVLREKMTLEFYGYPLDFLDRFQDEIRAVSTEEVQRVARQYIHRDDVAILVVGNPPDFDGELGELGEVREIDITIPQPGASQRTAITEDDQGRQLAELVVRGLGGARAVDSVHSIRRVGQVDARTPQGPMTIAIESLEVFPDTLRQTMRLPMGEITMVATPTDSFMLTPMGPQPLPGSQKEELLKSMAKNPLRIARNIGNPGYVFSSGGTETIDGTSARVLNVEAEGNRIRWYLDPRTGYILRSESSGTSMSGAPVTETTIYSDFRETGGVMQPHRITVLQEGEESATVSFETIEVNPTIPDDAFSRPQDN